MTREEALSQARTIVAATDLPVSADLEKGFGDTLEIVAETIRFAAAAGLVGCSIEDATGHRQQPIFDFEHAVERVAAYRAAMTGLFEAAREVKERGTFGFLDRLIDVNKFMQR